jgi:opacity protein-like surface antigen
MWRRRIRETNKVTPMRKAIGTLSYICGALLLVVGLPGHAQADWFVSPLVGTTFKGDAGHASPAVGVTGGWLGSGWLGAEADLGWAPEFFQQDGFLTSRRVTTLVGNAVVKLPSMSDSRLIPYASGGFGLLRVNLSEAGGLSLLERNKLAADIGGGASALFSQNVGVRGDIRYFRALRENTADQNPFGINVSSLHFWRIAGGLFVRF